MTKPAEALVETLLAGVPTGLWTPDDPSKAEGVASFAVSEGEVVPDIEDRFLSSGKDGLETRDLAGMVAISASLDRDKPGVDLSSDTREVRVSTSESGGMLLRVSDRSLTIEQDGDEHQIVRAKTIILLDSGLTEIHSDRQEIIDSHRIDEGNIANTLELVQTRVIQPLLALRGAGRAALPPGSPPTGQ